jgi:hypothetical protein
MKNKEGKRTGREKNRQAHKCSAPKKGGISLNVEC